MSTYAFNGVGVKVMGRNELEELSRDGFADGTYVISIVDTHAPAVRFAHRPARLLRMVFDDVGNDEHPIDCHIMEDADEEDLAAIELISNPITPEQGERIARFIEDNLANMEYLICQCEMGQSRSAAVAAAVMEHYTGIPSDIFADNRYYPNKLVFVVVRDALQAIAASDAHEQQDQSDVRRKLQSVHDIQAMLAANAQRNPTEGNPEEPPSDEALLEDVIWEHHSEKRLGA